MVNYVTANGNTYNDGSTAPGNMANGGHRTNLLPMLRDVMVEVAQVSSRLIRSSDSVVVVGSGSKAFTLSSSGGSFSVGQWVVATSVATSSWMVGQVTAFTDPTLTISVASNDYSGSGSASDWVIAIGGRTAPRPTITTSSTSSIAIGTGSRTFSTVGNLDVGVGAWLLVADASSPTANYMIGQATSVSSGSLSINVTIAQGSGTFSNWTISITSQPGSQNTNQICEGGAATGTANAPIVTASPAFTGARGEMLVFLTGASANTDVVTITANGVVQTARKNGSAMVAGDLPAGTRVAFVSDGTYLELVSGGSAASSGGGSVTLSRHLMSL